MTLTRRTFLRTALLAGGAALTACTPASTPATAPAETPAASYSTLEPVTDPTQTPAPPTPTAEPEVVVLAEGLDFPEGPAFDPQGGLWCTEMGKGNLIRLLDGKVERIATEGRPNSLAFDRQGRAWICDSLQNAIRRYDPTSDKWETLLEEIDGQPLHTPNDLAFDARGNLVFTCPNFDSEDPTGYVACLRPDGTAVRLVEGWNRPNGLDFVEDGRRLVVADTFRKTLFSAPWDAEGTTWKDPQPWVEVGGSEGPDGMAPGADGLLYQTVYGDGVVRVVDVAQAKVAREIRLPDRNPTNAAIDPSGKLGLVITGAETGRLLSLPAVRPGAAIFDGGEVW